VPAKARHFVFVQLSTDVFSHRKKYVQSFSRDLLGVPGHLMRGAGQAAKLQTLYRDGGRDLIAHALLIKLAGTRVCGMEFQRSEVRTVLTPPILHRFRQPYTDPLLLARSAYRDFRDVAVDDFSVHWIRRLFESGVHKSDDLMIQLRDQCNALCIGRMLTPLSVPCRYRRNCGDRVAFRVNASMILSTFQERAGNAVSVFRNRPTDRNCHFAMRFAHEKKCLKTLQPVTPAGTKASLG
jgi:hypothetical protein